jgi:hypothetical protein
MTAQTPVHRPPLNIYLDQSVYGSFRNESPADWRRSGLAQLLLEAQRKQRAQVWASPTNVMETLQATDLGVRRRKNGYLTCRRWMNPKARSVFLAPKGEPHSWRIRANPALGTNRCPFADQRTGAELCPAGLGRLGETRVAGADGAPTGQVSTALAPPDVF